MPIRQSNIKFILFSTFFCFICHEKHLYIIDLCLKNKKKKKTQRHRIHQEIKFPSQTKQVLNLGLHYPSDSHTPVPGTLGLYKWSLEGYDWHYMGPPVDSKDSRTQLAGKRPETWFDIVCQNAKSCIVFKSNVASICLNIDGADNLEKKCNGIVCQK